MSNPKDPSSLKRFKNNTQGLIEFATLIEQSDPKSREMILKSATAEDARWVDRAMRKVVFFDELIFLDETILAEILSKISPKVMAFALRGTPAEFRETFTKQLGHREKKMTQDEDSNIQKELSENFILGAQRQVLKTARSMEAQNKFSFELLDCPRFHKKAIKTG
jgi:flagellar motor switch protein FliG